MPSTIDKHILALWQQIIKQTKLGSALGAKSSGRKLPPRELCDFAELTEFDLANKVATIRVESQPTAKAISPYLPKLESAFESVLRVDIKIRLEVPEVEVVEDIDKSSFTNQGLGAPLEWTKISLQVRDENCSSLGQAQGFVLPKC